MTDAREDAVLLSVGEVGERLHLHPQTVRRLMNQGQLAFVRLGKYRMVEPAALLAFIAAHRSNGNGDSP